METEVCKYCDSPEIDYESRGICKTCYSYLFQNNRLDEYPKRDLYIKRLKKRYGDRIVLDFELCMYNLNNNLTKIGEKYGFCRERARQIFNDLFGDTAYKNARGWLQRLIDESNRTINFHPKNRFNKL